MGSYTFKWPHAATEVYVTGTFDNWSQSEKLDKVGDVFEKTVALPDASEKIFYKFVVDGNWTTNNDAPQEKDHDGNDNNVLKPEDIVKEPSPASVTMSNIAPDSTTVQLAGAVPLEEKKENVVLPGDYPETPATDLDNKEVKVNPLPAADGAINPIKLAPGEKIPDDVATQGLNSHVTLDKESYENSDAFPGVQSVPPISANMIPESSLPIAGANDVTLNTVAPGSTTAALAADVPLEPKVPEVVKDSQEEAKADPEASGVSEGVTEKAQVETELLDKVTEAPSTSEGTAGQGTEKSEGDKTVAEAATDAVAAAGTAAVEIAATTQDKATEAVSEAANNLPEPVKDQLPEAVKQNGAAAEAEAKLETVSPEVPAEVKESIKDAGESPEAAANTEAVEEKKAVEAELLKEVKTVEPAAGEASATAAAAAAPKTEEEPKAQEPAAETKPETNGVETPTPTPATAGSSAPSASKASDSPAAPAATEKKKKNRLSSLFNRFRRSKDKVAKDKQ